MALVTLWYILEINIISRIHSFLTEIFQPSKCFMILIKSLVNSVLLKSLLSFLHRPRLQGSMTGFFMAWSRRKDNRWYSCCSGRLFIRRRFLLIRKQNGGKRRILNGRSFEKWGLNALVIRGLLCDMEFVTNVREMDVLVHLAENDRQLGVSKEQETFW